MATKEEVESIRWMLWGDERLAPETTWRARARILLSAIDEANNRIDELEAECEVDPLRDAELDAVIRANHAHSARAELAEAKLAKVRFWADADSANGDSNVSTDTAYEQLIAILDGKDAP